MEAREHMDGSAVKVPATEVDVFVVGAGFGGLTMLYRLRERGFSMQGVEMGGTYLAAWRERRGQWLLERELYVTLQHGAARLD